MHVKDTNVFVKDLQCKKEEIKVAMRYHSDKKRKDKWKLLVDSSILFTVHMEFCE